jgi:hypothetical protein
MAYKKSRFVWCYLGATQTFWHHLWNISYRMFIFVQHFVRSVIWYHEISSMHYLFCSLFRDTFSGTHTYRSQIFVTKERDSLLNPLSHIMGNGSMGRRGVGRSMLLQRQCLITDSEYFNNCHIRVLLDQGSGRRELSHFLTTSRWMTTKLQQIIWLYYFDDDNIRYQIEVIYTKTQSNRHRKSLVCLLI